MSLLVVGSVAFDAIETPFGKTEWTAGGAATYFSLAAALLSPVRLVGVVGEDFTAKDEAVFRGRKIDLAGLERASGKSFFWAGRYSSDLRSRETLRTDLNVFAAFTPKLPETYRESPFVFLGNIDPALQRNVLKQMRRRPKLVALDTMNYWISRTRKELGKTLKLIDALLINDEEACQLAEESNLLRAARKILRMGPKALVIKRGEYGSMMFHGDSILAVPAYPLEDVRDPTGAGDSFAGGFMGYLASHANANHGLLRRAMLYGSVLGSFAVEQLGVARLRTLKRREVEARVRALAQMMHVQI
ncbi:MAG TPA: PfkB family carbohydrate kinase [Candidatus Limnocylindrales bacterium]|nr:PfkB family carbohydrate kinase [Candidatus Limnocylindrales bacterium]